MEDRENQHFKWDLVGKVLECLQQNPEKKFTGQEIAIWILTNYPDVCEKKRERSAQDLSSNAAFLLQVVREIQCNKYIRAKKKYPQIKITESSPPKYYYSIRDNIENIDQLDDAKTDQEEAKKEKDLYPLLSEFLFEKLLVYSKRIDEKVSKKNRGNQGNKWLHPDLVGMEDLSYGWNESIKLCAQYFGDKKARLWSFEVKKFIKRCEVREVFLQTVGNSSWAHYGYLVAEGFLNSDDEFKKELHMLSKLHGIGIILLNTENVLNSEIMISAKEKSSVDWDFVNRLAGTNADFKNYIDNVHDFFHNNARKQPLDARDWDYNSSNED